jgi:hypothetical protein
MVAEVGIGGEREEEIKRLSKISMQWREREEEKGRVVYKSAYVHWWPRHR